MTSPSDPEALEHDDTAEPVSPKYLRCALNPKPLKPDHPSSNISPEALNFKPHCKTKEARSCTIFDSRGGGVAGLRSDRTKLCSLPEIFMTLGFQVHVECILRLYRVNYTVFQAH